ncbi:hypothetical protein IFM89_003241 [Coptis chinensis]|uniref:Pentatricopeptide repeat-containing protein n=1 Tax=Coptis chinensis TaxID=261450 RepID=A0A835M3J3_9MAGN|nr:hypothetical protein IFM89_003241 [Coptis chinensis]
MIRKVDIKNPVEQARIIRFCCLHEMGDMDYARILFDQILEPNVVIWNTMIRGYSRRKAPRDAALVYLEMLERGFGPDHYTFPFLLKAFNRQMTLDCGKGFHGKLFNKSSKRDVVSWNAMISGYNKIQRYQESQKLFNEMEKENVEPSAVTLVLVVSACAKLKDLETGMKVHQYVKDYRIATSLILENVMVDMYAACGKMDLALGLFDSMKVRDVITWTTMVSGFTNSGQLDRAREFFELMPERDYVSWTAMTDGYLKANHFKEALEIFREMQGANIRPDEFIMISILTTCAQLGALEVGEWIRIYIEKNKIKKDVFVASALIDMYSKCGNTKGALEIFEDMPHRDKFS